MALKVNEKLALLGKGVSWKEVKELDAQHTKELEETPAESEKETETPAETEKETENPLQKDLDAVKSENEELKKQIAELQKDNVNKDISSSVKDLDAEISNIFTDFKL